MEHRSAARFIRALPKAEVHVHLEGAVGLADLIEQAKAVGAVLPGPAATLYDPATHHHLPVASELSAYLRFLDWEGSLFRTREHVARVAYRFAARQSASGIRYTDVIVNPTHWPSWRPDVHGLLDALASGFDEAEADGLCVVNVCVSLDRGQSRTDAVELAELLVARRPARVVALSIDGDEAATGRTAPTFSSAFEIARDGGLHRTVHAGESSGPEGVWDALTLLHADRIDHGVRAIEDERLIEHLAATGVPLGVCPSSNLTLGLAESLQEHPLQRLLERGVVVTVNTDDPAPLSVTLEEEWAMCAVALGWDEERLTALARTSIAASFASESLRERLSAELDALA